MTPDSSGPPLLIRADANPDIGIGHVMRCRALGEYWQDEVGPVIFACHSISAELRSRLELAGFDVEPVRSEPGSRDDEKETCRLVESSRAGAVVIDGYRFGPEYQATVAAKVAVSMVIDDYAHLNRYASALILNQNSGVSEDLYRGKTDTSEFLIGPDYALLGKAIRTGRRDSIPGDNTTRRGLVTLGGSAARQTYHKILQTIEQTSWHDVEYLVISPDSSLTTADSRIRLVPFVDNMAELYRQTDFAICAGGSTNWEMAFFGIPRIVIVLAENQSRIASSLHELGCCYLAGWHENLTSQQVAVHLQQLLDADVTTMRQANRSLVDGNGVERVASRLLDAWQQRVTRQQRN